MTWKRGDVTVVSGSNVAILNTVGSGTIQSTLTFSAATLEHEGSIRTTHHTQLLKKIIFSSGLYRAVVSQSGALTVASDLFRIEVVAVPLNPPVFETFYRPFTDLEGRFETIQNLDKVRDFIALLSYSSL